MIIQPSTLKYPSVHVRLQNLNYPVNINHNNTVLVAHAQHSIFDRPQSGVVYNFGRVCLSVYMYVCQTITFESLP